MGQRDQLGELQLAVLRVLWERGECTVTEVHEALREDRGLAPTTIATTLTGLERRGLVEHRTEGRRYLYRALVEEGATTRGLVDELVERVFQGDSSALLRHLLSDSDVDPKVLADLERRIERRSLERESP